MRSCLPHLFLLMVLTAPAAQAAQDVSLYRSLQQKGNTAGTQPRRTPPPSTGFVENMRQKGVTSLPTTSRPADVAKPAGVARKPAVPAQASPHPLPGAAPAATSSRSEAPSAAAAAAAPFNGRIQSDGRGGFRLFDASGRQTKTMTPDGRGGYRIYDPAGHYLGRVTSK